MQLLVGAAVAFLLVRCSSFETAPLPEDIPETGDVAPPEAAPREDATSSAAVGCDPTCAGDAGPCSVRVETSCIDATEVTVGDFRVFANAPRDGGVDAGKPCALVKPSPIGQVVDEQLPMVNVDMCTARAYCAWAGKHLCGGVDGGVVARGHEREQGSAWYHACTGGYDLVTSHFIDDAGCRLDASSPVEVGTTCQGGVAGLSEMVGNVWEWIDMVDRPDGSATYQGVIVGGGYRLTAADCNSLLVSADIALKSADIGFRCCSP